MALTLGVQAELHLAQKWRTRSDLKHYESEKNIYVGRHKSSKKKKKRREKAFMEEVKTFQAKQTLHLSTLFQLYPGEVHSTTLHK